MELYGSIFFMNDIQTRSDLELLMESFYTKLLSDGGIGYIFTDVMKIDLPSHLPHLVDFWSQNILGLGTYRKNVLQIHLDIDRREQLTDEHFKIWLAHFNATVDEHFKGEKSELIKTRALSIATIMRIKLKETH